MKTRRSRASIGLLVGTTALLLASCNSAQQTTPAEAAAPPAGAEMIAETQQVADAVLGKQAEILAHGDLARNGSEQLLVVNRLGKAAHGAVEPGDSSEIFVTRAVIVEKDNGKWAEVLRGDEHLKNPNGYLGGVPAAPVTGWRLDLKPDSDQGLELRFTPAETGEVRSSDAVGMGSHAIVIQWNKKAKRYQSLDQSHKGFLGEVPTLETPQSILR
jgi:hypothetical protein